MSKQAQQIETMQDRILASRKMLKPGDAHYKGYEQYAGKHPTPNPRIDRQNVRLVYQCVNKITYSPTARIEEATYKFNAIVAKNGKVGRNEIPGLLHHVNYVIIRQPNTNKLYALPYRVDQLLQNDKNDITIELYKNEEDDAKTIISVGNAEAMIDSMTDSPAWIAINNCDPFGGSGSEDELEKLQLTKPLMQYIKMKKQRYVAATCGFNGGQELASDGYTVLHTQWDYCLNVDPFHYVKGDAIGTTKPITFDTIQNLMPRYGANDLLLELTYGNNQMPMLQKNRAKYTVMIGEMGIDLKSPDYGDIQMPPHVSIVPPRMTAPYLHIPENFIETLAFIINKSKKHVQDITFRIFKHNDPRCYYIQASGAGAPYQVTCTVETKLTKEEQAERLAQAAQAQAAKEARWKAQDEAEEAARRLGQEERDKVIHEAQERLKAEETAALQEHLKAEQEEVERIRAAKQATPTDNYKTAMAIIANPKKATINYLPTYTIPQPRPNAEQWEIDAYIAQRYLRTMQHFLSSMIFYRDDIEGFQWRTTYILSNAHHDTFKKRFPKRPSTTNHESYIKHLNATDKAPLHDTTIFATGSGVITYRNGVEYVFKFEEVEPASPELLAALSRPVQYNPGLAGIVEMEIEPEAIDSSSTPIHHPVYDEDSTKIITPTFTAPSILDEFEAATAIVPLPSKPTLPELPAVIEEVIDTPKPVKPVKVDYLQDEQALTSLLASLSKIVGINVLLVGTWLWIDGDTKPVKEQLKSLGFRWHSQKKMWYMSLSGEYFKTKTKTHFIDIAMKYGVRTLKTND